MFNVASHNAYVNGDGMVASENDTARLLNGLINESYENYVNDLNIWVHESRSWGNLCRQILNRKKSFHTTNKCSSFTLPWTTNSLAWFSIRSSHILAPHFNWNFHIERVREQSWEKVNLNFMAEGWKGYRQSRYAREQNSFMFTQKTL